MAELPSGKILADEWFVPRAAVGSELHRFPEAKLAAEVVGVGYLVTGYFPAEEMLGPQILVTHEHVLDRQVNRLVIRDVTRTAEEFVALTAQASFCGVEAAVGFQAWLDIVPAGVSKATSLARYAASRGIPPGHVVAIGDGRNDVEMLRWAGRGVAMGHAPAEVHAAADAVTGSVAVDGAALEIERWFAAGTPPDAALGQTPQSADHGVQR